MFSTPSCARIRKKKTKQNRDKIGPNYFAERPRVEVGLLNQWAKPVTLETYFWSHLITTPSGDRIRKKRTKRNREEARPDLAERQRVEVGPLNLSAKPVTPKTYFRSLFQLFFRLHPVPGLQRR